MQIIRMRKEDIIQIAALEKQVFSMPWSEQGFLDTLSMPNVIFYEAVEAAQVCGYCGIYLAADEGEITNVAVDPAYRRRGIAESMVTKLMEAAAGEGARQFVLEVRASNEPAIRLYEKLGFTGCGVRKHFYEKPTEDAIVMICRQ